MADKPAIKGYSKPIIRPRTHVPPITVRLESLFQGTLVPPITINHHLNRTITRKVISYKSGEKIVSIRDAAIVLESGEKDGIKHTWSGRVDTSSKANFTWNIDWKDLKNQGAHRLVGHLIVSSVFNHWHPHRVDIDWTDTNHFEYNLTAYYAESSRHFDYSAFGKPIPELPRPDVQINHDLDRTMTTKVISYKSPQKMVSNSSAAIVLESGEKDGIKHTWSGRVDTSSKANFTWNIDWKDLKNQGAHRLVGHLIQFLSESAVSKRSNCREASEDG
ncbi:hypothetical protein L5515_015671 [Caenorhabditis briggsae]|uniref:Uncharacterized protein n=1 Tax=Caenorhabditis briggsae TaxID=6238 RepID=A0AAE9ECC9_CAEBR|nr:hypothetical protein L5515_015671 [Caenorhabditis briggsae]